MKNIGQRPSRIDWSSGQHPSRVDWSTQGPAPKKDLNIERAEKLSRSIRSELGERRQDALDLFHGLQRLQG